MPTYRVKLNARYGAHNAGDTINLINKDVVDDLTTRKFNTGHQIVPWGVLLETVTDAAPSDERPGGEAPPQLLARLQREGHTVAEVPALAGLKPPTSTLATPAATAPKSNPAPATKPPAQSAQARK